MKLDGLVGSAQIEKHLEDLPDIRHQEKKRIAFVIADQPPPTLKEEIANDQRPCVDNYALQEEFGADLLHLNDAKKTWAGRLFTYLFGPKLALVWTAFSLRHAYDSIYTTAEIIGLPLALLLKLSGTRRGQPRHVTLAHYLSPFKKRIFIKLGVVSHIDTLIVHCTAQYTLATQTLGIANKRVVKLPYFVDINFWRPLAPSDTPLIADDPALCAVGLEFRDHATLVEAVSGLPVKMRIAAAGNHIVSARSHYGTARMPADLLRLPANVSIRSYDYVAMRQLYANSRFVIVPLRETDFQAGITTILEAMAMGKAVIVSGTRGQTDVVHDPRYIGRGHGAREESPGFLDAPDLAETLGSLPTGFYVTPGDPHELRATIQYLLDHPGIADEMGRNGRQIVEEYFTVDAFVQRFVAAIRGTPTQPS